jgi:hypothetical protein
LPEQNHNVTPFLLLPFKFFLWSVSLDKYNIPYPQRNVKRFREKNSRQIAQTFGHIIVETAEQTKIRAAAHAGGPAKSQYGKVHKNIRQSLCRLPDRILKHHSKEVILTMLWIWIVVICYYVSPAQSNPEKESGAKAASYIP